MPLHPLDDIDARDLSEAPRLAKDPQSTGLIAGAIAVAVLFIALLVYGSLPELSPAEIVAMEGYEGEQPTKYIFNIHSLEDKDGDTPRKPVDKSQPVAVAEHVAVTDSATMAPESGNVGVENLQVEMDNNSAAETVVVDESSPMQMAVAPVDKIQAEKTPVELNHAKPIEINQAKVEQTELAKVEIEPVIIAEVAETKMPQTILPTKPPLADAELIEAESVAKLAPLSDTGSRTISFDTDRKKVVAAMATTPTIEESADTVVVASVAAVEPIPVLVSSSVADNSIAGAEVNSKGKLLPLRSVLRDATELKATPSTGSKTLLSLQRGVIVTAFERYGDWIHIGTNDGSSITGYVRQTSLGLVDSKNPG